MRTAAIIAAVLLAPAAVAADRPRVPVAVPSGPPVTCVPIYRLRESHVRDDRTIDFVVSGRKIYRNILPASCPGLGFEQRFAYETSLSQLCSTDIITVLYASGPTRGASCGLGQFQPATLARR